MPDVFQTHISCYCYLPFFLDLEDFIKPNKLTRISIYVCMANTRQRCVITHFPSRWEIAGVAQCAQMPLQHLGRLCAIKRIDMSLMSSFPCFLCSSSLPVHTLPFILKASFEENARCGYHWTSQTNTRAWFGPSCKTYTNRCTTACSILSNSTTVCIFFLLIAYSTPDLHTQKWCASGPSCTQNQQQNPSVNSSRWCHHACCSARVQNFKWRRLNVWSFHPFNHNDSHIQWFEISFGLVGAGGATDHGCSWPWTLFESSGDI